MARSRTRDYSDARKYAVNVMNVLLVNMVIRAQAKPNILPIGLGYLASVLEKQGHHCTILDLNRYRPVITDKQLEEEILTLDNSFDIIGLSGMITTLYWQKKVAKLLRHHFPTSSLISGGGLASDFGELLFQWIPELDAVVRGEGEPFFLQLTDQSRPVDQCKKVFGPTPVKSLDSIPPVAWHLLDTETYLANPIWGTTAGNSSWTNFTSSRSINLISSRGCPYNCNFCDRLATGGRDYRLHSSSRLMKDVSLVQEHFGVDFIGFLDDNFLADKKRLREFLPQMQTTGIAWGCHGRLSDIDDNFAAELRKAGCIYIGFGGESADPEVLKRMNKKSNPAQMSKAIRSCQKNDIVPNCTWIMGYSGETRDSLRKTASFILEHQLNQKAMFVATAYPGTHFFEEVEEKIFKAYSTLEEYVLDLDDASKILSHGDRVLNYSMMPDDVFLRCRQYVIDGQLEKI